MFPLGDTRKADVRREAEQRGLAVADKPDSHDICFIADGDTAGFLRAARRRPARSSTPTASRSASTTGASRSPSASAGAADRPPGRDGKPRYVLDVSPGDPHRPPSAPPSSSDVGRLVGVRPVWTGPPPVVPTACLAQVARATATRSPPPAWCEGDTLVVELAEPLRGVAPGQARGALRR
jgi:tRNA-specific 2-thiouridylase